MQSSTRSPFTTVKSEGAILPTDLLQQIVAQEMDGMSPQAYYLAPNERLSEAITRSWNRCLGVWRNFQEQREHLPAERTGITLTRERWLLILFQELGYGRLHFQRSIDVGDVSYPLSHLADNTPLHLTTFRQPIDKRDVTLKRSPHSMMQELLNRSDAHLWGMVSNGLTLRVLRDSASLTRAAYLEFDLDGMMTGEAYSDFTLLWLVCHHSRVVPTADGDAPTTPANCWLEKWSQSAADQGTRALDALRDGVQEAITALGQGFLAQRANGELRAALKSGTLSTGDYYRQLLRLVYRMIFLFVAEERDLLLLPETTEAVRERYRDYYSIGRFRPLAAIRRGSPHPDLYRTLRHISQLLRSGYAPLGLPALGGFLFSERATPNLDAADLANRDLLAAVRVLAFTLEKGVRRPVDYKNLGAEELGSVYESLLELHPQIHIEAAQFTLDAVAGSERKTTGSYYTPSSLINELLNSALEPVVADRLQTAREKSQDAPRTTHHAPLEEAILNIKVVDPACGSGHFLIAAANRLARHLARVRTGDEEPSPEAQRKALRDVVRRCIHGVDINEMAVELCKVALWMETLDPGKPLGFLDKNIQCGNSLIGATPALLRRGIPDDAFKPITGDDKKAASYWKKRNKAERTGQRSMTLGERQPWERLGDLATALLQIDQLGNETLDDVEAQRTRYSSYLRSTDYELNRLWADAWCAAFVWKKESENVRPMTEQVFRNIERNPYSEKDMWPEIQRLRDDYQFFHWHLAFPQIFVPKPATNVSDDEVTGWQGGFDVILGNPPWEQIQLDPREFFATLAPEIANARNMAARNKLINSLKLEHPILYQLYITAVRKNDGHKHFIHASGYFPFTSVGRLNLAPLFTELSRRCVSEYGQLALIIPTGIATDSYNQQFFADLIDRNSLVELIGFENEEFIFSGIANVVRFCILVVSGRAIDSIEPKFAFYIRNMSQLSDQRRYSRLLKDDFALLNPNTRNCPIFRSNVDATITKKLYRQSRVLINEKASTNEWGISQMLMFMMNSDSGLFETSSSDTNLPLYEGKLFWHFDHRFGSYEFKGLSGKGGRGLPNMPLECHTNPNYEIQPRYWVDSAQVNKKLSERWSHNWLLSFREVTSAKLERTVVASIIPKVAVGHKAPIIFPHKSPSTRHSACLLANLNSIIFDYIARQKVGGTSLSYFILKQLPVLEPSIYTVEQIQFIVSRVVELSYTSWGLRAFADECGFAGSPFLWDEERRFTLQAELNALYAHLYQLDRESVLYILEPESVYGDGFPSETFRVLKSNELKLYGSYRTKEVILAIYDEMATAMQTGVPYQTRLDPPPGDPRAAHPWDEERLGEELPMEEWWQESVNSGAVNSEPLAVREAQVSYGAGEGVPALDVGKVARKAENVKREKTRQPSLLEHAPEFNHFEPPAGSRSERLKRVMRLGKPKNVLELQELIAAMGDVDGSIQWLASGSVARLGEMMTVDALRAFLTTEINDAAREGAVKALGMIGETAEDVAVRDAARGVLEDNNGK